MRPNPFFRLAAALCLSAFSLTTAFSAVRERILLNNDWLFAKGHAADPRKDFGYGMALSFSKVAFLQESTMLDADQVSRLSVPHTERFDDSTWTKIDLPHDWGMGLDYGEEQFKVKGYRKLGGRAPENSVGWYRKHFTLDTVDFGSRYTLEFEGVFRDAQVWVNGIYQGRHESGYTGFTFDITESLNAKGKNTITVRVDATHSELWSYEGAGIYRNVWLEKTSAVHVPRYGTFVRADIPEAGDTARLTALTEVRNETSKPVAVVVKSVVSDPAGRTVASAKTPLTVAALETSAVEPAFRLDGVRRWSLEAPAMYTLRTRIYRSGRLADEYTTPFGIRSIRFDSDSGFYLNGKRVQIQGVCCHQDHAGVGIGVPDNLNVWRIKRLKEYGVNSYRASHNPPAKSILDACDTLGVLMLDELRVLSSSAEGLDQLEYLIRRDRNHPSVILWCLGNEEPAIQGNDRGQRIVERMMAAQRKLDPTRESTAAMNGSWGSGFSKAVDVQGSNYYHIGNLDALHKQMPDLPLLLTEEASTVMTRGEYRTDAKRGVHQAYDRDRPGWGATAQEWMRYVGERPFIAGAYVWTGFDYGGEAQLHFWPGVVSHFGILDYCGFPKDAYWYYKAWWTDEPVLHILPHWNGDGLPLVNDSVDVHVYSNMDEVELKLNGRSLGRKKLGKYDIAEFRVRFAPGKLEAIGRKDGKRYTAVQETTGRAVRMVLENVTGAPVGTNDVGIVNIRMADAKGRTVPTDSTLLRFRVENGYVAGVGNGHPSSHERDCFGRDEVPYRKAFHGLAQVIVRSDGSGKPVVVRAEADGMPGVSVELPVR